MRNYLPESSLPEHFLKPKKKTLFIMILTVASGVVLVLPHWGKLQQCCRWCRGSQCHKAQSQGNKSHHALVSTVGHCSHLKIHNLKRRAKKCWDFLVNFILHSTAWLSHNNFDSKGRLKWENSGAKEGTIIINGCYRGWHSTPSSTV